MLRRNGLTNITKAAIEHLRETKGDNYTDEDAMTYASSIAGHENASTLVKHYVKTHRTTDVDKHDRQKPYAINAKLRQTEKELAELKAKIAESKNE
jgi:hypothetical protein